MLRGTEMLTPRLALTPQLFAIFASLVEEACGLHYGPKERSLFESKLAVQAAEAGFDSLLDYYYRLRYNDPDGSERRALVQALLVHETYLFRELPALVALVDEYLAPAVAARGRARVWSAACASGEEPLTLAMLLDRRGILERVEIVATDVSEAAIAAAREGRYGRRSLRDGHPADLALRYVDTAGRGVVVAQHIRDAVTWSTLNLLDAHRARALGTFDAIVCRNVLIYFSDATVVRVLDTLREMLAPDGVIAVGVSESLMRFGTGLRCEERGGSFFYRGVR